MNTIINATPVNIPKDFNGVQSNILYSATNDCIASFYHVNQDEKEEIARRINEYPKLVKAVIRMFDEEDNSDAIEKLRGMVHNVSRKTLDKWK